MLKHLCVLGSIALLPFAATSDNTSSTALAAYPVPAKEPATIGAARVCNSLSLPRGFEPIDGSNAFELRSELVKLTDRAVAKGGFSGFLADVFWQQDPPDEINTACQ